MLSVIENVVLFAGQVTVTSNSSSVTVSEVVLPDVDPVEVLELPIVVPDALVLLEVVPELLPSAVPDVLVLAGMAPVVASEYCVTVEVQV